MELTEPMKDYLIATAQMLHGSARRLFLARTVQLLGPGGQRAAERELRWNRVTVRKGLHELATGIRCLDGFAARGRKPSEHHLPRLLPDIRDVVEVQSQADPRFQSQRLYTRLTAAAVREQLVLRKGYQDDELPCTETIRRKVLQLGYRLRKVAKCRPKKRFRRRTRSSPAWGRSIPPPTWPRTSCGCRWMPRRP